jgi:hypothetical protein
MQLSHAQAHPSPELDCMASFVPCCGNPEGYLLVGTPDFAGRKSAKCFSLRSSHRRRLQARGKSNKPLLSVGSFLSSYLVCLCFNLLFAPRGWIRGGMMFEA